MEMMYKKFQAILCGNNQTGLNLEKTVIKVMGSRQHIRFLQSCSVDTEVYSTQVMCEKFQAILLINK